MNMVDRETINLAWYKFEDMPRGSWVVCQVCDKDVSSTPEEVYTEEIIFLSDKDIDSLRVVDFWKELKARKRPMSGNKPVLAERLKGAVSKRIPSYTLVVSGDTDQNVDQPNDADQSNDVNQPNVRLRNFTVANDCCYIVFKDKKNITCYCNDVTGKPGSRVVDPKDDETIIYCVHGLAPLHRWIGIESMYRTTFLVPALVVVYNIFMNGVDRFDQKRSTIPVLRKEMKVSMSIFTWILNAACINANTMCSVTSGDDLELIEFKRRISIEFVRPLIMRRGYKKSLIRRIMSWKNATRKKFGNCGRLPYY